MSPIQLEVEAWSRTPVEVSAEVADGIASSGLVAVELERSPNRWSLQADSKVGIAATHDWELRVHPRIAIPRLMFLLGYASDPDGWRTAAVSFEAERDLFAAIANGYTVHAERAISPAPLFGYVSRDETANAFRGRLRIADQIARAHSRPLPLEIRFDDFIADIPENRFVVGAAEQLLRFPHIPARTRARLRRVKAVLDGVSPMSPDPHLRPLAETRLNQQYGAALKLAHLILTGSSVSTRAGRVASIAFAFDMNQVFEDFLSAALRRALERRGGRVRLQWDGTHLDEERRIRLKPDITWWQDGRSRAVIDAKYKPLTDNRFPNADAYQMLAYCTALNLRAGHLVYAKDAVAHPRQHRVRAADPITISVRAVDIEREPEEVLEQIERLARSIESPGEAEPMLRST